MFYESGAELEDANLVFTSFCDFRSFFSFLFRRHWADFFTSLGVRFAFFSAADAAALQAARAAEEEAAAAAESSEDDDEEETEDDTLEQAAEELSLAAHQGKALAGKEASERIQERSDLLASDSGVPTSTSENDNSKSTNPLAAAGSIDPTKVLNVFELESLFQASAPLGWESVTPYGFNSAAPHALAKPKLTVGLVGYPNVGKSSTLNALLGAKKVSVSATPGEFKLYLNSLSF